MNIDTLPVRGEFSCRANMTQRIGLFARLKLEWSGASRVVMTRMLRVNLINVSKTETCKRSAEEKVHSCANAESREDCEKSCGIGGGFLGRYALFISFRYQHRKECETIASDRDKKIPKRKSKIFLPWFNLMSILSILTYRIVISRHDWLINSVIEIFYLKGDIMKINYPFSFFSKHCQLFLVALLGSLCLTRGKHSL